MPGFVPLSLVVVEGQISSYPPPEYAAPSGPLFSGSLRLHVELVVMTHSRTQMQGWGLSWDQQLGDEWIDGRRDSLLMQPG